MKNHCTGRKPEALKVSELMEKGRTTEFGVWNGNFKLQIDTPLEVMYLPYETTDMSTGLCECFPINNHHLAKHTVAKQWAHYRATGLLQPDWFLITKKDSLCFYPGVLKVDSLAGRWMRSRRKIFNLQISMQKPKQPAAMLQNKCISSHFTGKRGKEKERK